MKFMGLFKFKMKNDSNGKASFGRIVEGKIEELNPKEKNVYVPFGLNKCLGKFPPYLEGILAWGSHVKFL
jgi:hypothetical protein